MSKILGFSTQRGALPITQKNATIDIRIFDVNYAFSIFLKDSTFFDEFDSELEDTSLEKLKELFLFYENDGSPEYNAVKTALNL